MEELVEQRDSWRHDLGWTEGYLSACDWSVKTDPGFFNRFKLAFSSHFWLQELGYKNVRVYQGLLDWKANGGELQIQKTPV